MSCPVCGGQMIGHGHKLKIINHPAFRDHKGIIHYNANRYICKDCKKTAFERNPFSFDGFNSSYFLIQNAMKLLGNLNYNLKMISDELNISTTQLCKYLDSYVTIPKRNVWVLMKSITTIFPDAIQVTFASSLIMLTAIYMMCSIQETNSTYPCIFQVFPGRKDAA